MVARDFSPYTSAVSEVVSGAVAIQDSPATTEKMSKPATTGMPGTNNEATKIT